jgi:single-strand DNA-binding protein
MIGTPVPAREEQDMDTGESITIVGNIAAAPERRQTPSGASVTTFRVGSTRRKLDKQKGEWVDDYTNWYVVNVWRTLGDHAYASLQKGNRVVVHGRLKAREWETDAKRGVSLEIEADAVGHDLQFGTTTYTRDERNVGSDASAEAPAVPAAPDPAPGDWGAPARSTDVWSAATATEPSREPVETPF